MNQPISANLSRTKRLARMAGHVGLLLTALVAVAFLAGVLYSIHLGSALRYPDEESYITLARNLAHGGMYTLDGVHPSAYRPPGYPLLLSVIAQCGGDIRSFRILNQAAFAASLFLLYGLVRRQSNGAAGLLAIFMALCYPVLFYTAGTLYPQTIAAALFLSALVLYFGTPALTLRRAALLGVIAGCLILTVPTFLFFLAFLCAWELVETRGRHVRQVGTMVLCAALILIPWSIRNLRELDAFVPVSTNSGINLLLGNSANTTPNAGVNVDISRYEARAPSGGEAERNRFYTGEAIRYVLNHPARSGMLYARKFLNYFNYRNTLWTKQEGSSLRDLIMLLTYGPFLLLAGLRLALAVRRPLTRYERFAAALYVLNGAFAAIFFTRIRFRVPFDFLLISLGAMGLAGRRREPSPPTL